MYASLTDAFIRKLPASPDAPYIVRDEEVKGFYVIVSKTRIAYFIQKDTGHNRRRRTIKKRIGVFGKTTTSDARKAARTELSKIENRTIVPLAGSATLRQAWERYRERHLKRRSSSLRTFLGRRRPTTMRRSFLPDMWPKTIHASQRNQMFDDNIEVVTDDPTDARQRAWKALRKVVHARRRHGGDAEGVAEGL